MDTKIFKMPEKIEIPSNYWVVVGVCVCMCMFKDINAQWKKVQWEIKLFPEKFEVLKYFKVLHL